MKKLIITIFLMSGLWVNASIMTPEPEKSKVYTYEQGKNIAVNSALCVVTNRGIVLMLEETLDRFEKETGIRNVAWMLLVMEIAQEYRTGMRDRYFPDETRAFIKSVVSDCRKIAESEVNKN